MSTRISARYCGRECQVKSFPSHKQFHSAFKSCKKDTTNPAFDIFGISGYYQTFCLTLMELKEAKKLPPLRNNGTTLSLLFAGARREMVIDYKILLELLKIFVYPTLKKLKVALVGPSLDGEGSLANTNDIEVQATKQTIEYLYKTSAALSKFDVIYTVSPGFTDNLDQWTPAVKLFTESNIPLVFTGYSSFDKKDNDALFDEDCLLTYFRAISIVPNT